MTLDPGTRLGIYEIQSLIGAGGMGEVYRATDSRLHRAIAIKLLPSAVGDDSQLFERFEREARATASLNHPSIVTIHSVEQAEGRHAGAAGIADGQAPGHRDLKPAMGQ